ncbi:glycosyltransferase family 4 protein [Microbacteriaceae bacterium VKM Ac-2855]|nr:glycosyltransferase family 4 protein [Microbacteriaceae bacterium VKM Ac-2855]
MSQSSHDSEALDAADIAIYARARTVHLKRFAEMGATLVYRKKNYDFDEEFAATHPSAQLGYAGTTRHLLRSTHRVVELNEPFQLDSWPGLLLAVTAIRISDAAHRRRTRIVTYAIGNDDLIANFAAYTRLPAPVAAFFVRRIFRYLLARYDRVAFGITSSREIYRELSGRAFDRPEKAFFGALAPRYPDAEIPLERTKNLVFLGALEERKGIVKLMEAWPLVQATGARLTILGKGPLADQVRVWAAARDDVDLIIDPARAVIHQTLLNSAVLVLFSQRTPRWREQIGLPILEGLSHGCTIVTSTETGIADWLDAHGHAVLAPDVSAGVLAEKLGDALEHPLPVATVLESLPAQDTRFDASDWMFEAGPNR